MIADSSTQQPVHLDCQLCPVSDCVGRLDDDGEGGSWHEALTSRQSLMPACGALFRTGDSLKLIYVVRAGCIKTSNVSADGREHIRGFHLPGDLVGLDALHEGRCPASALAVIPSQLCAVSLTTLKHIMVRYPQLGHRMLAQVSRELSMALSLAGDHSAEARIAAFLLQMRRRLGAKALTLPMPQRDIGNYLRLATETVCRTMKLLQGRGWIRVAGRRVEFVNVTGLQCVAEQVGLDRSQSQWAHAA